MNDRLWICEACGKVLGPVVDDSTECDCKDYYDHEYVLWVKQETVESDRDALRERVRELEVLYQAYKDLVGERNKLVNKLDIELATLRAEGGVLTRNLRELEIREAATMARPAITKWEISIAERLSALERLTKRLDNLIANTRTDVKALEEWREGMEANNG